MRRPVILAVLAGVLLALSFPKFGHPAVAWVALAPLLLALDAARGRAAFRLGFTTGVVSSLGLLYWTALVVQQFGGLGPLVAGLAMLLLCLAFALGHGLFAAVVAAWWRDLGRWTLLLAPLAWVAVELLRVRTYFHFPWLLLGYSQHSELAWIQLASVGGVYAVSALVALPAGVIAWSVGESPTRRRTAFAALALVLVGVFAWGMHRLSAPVETSGALRVALVQPSIAQDEKWRDDLLVEHFLRHLRLSREQASGARLVVWPESSVPWSPVESYPGVLERLRELASDADQYLLFGNDDREGVGRDSRIYVGAKLLGPGGEIGLRHHKQRLVPFGEYVPLAPVFTLGGRFTARLVDAVGTFTPGEELRLGVVDGVPLGALVCYEAIFPELTREYAAAGAGLLTNLTNDAWYGRTSAPWQHFAMTRVRAVETGRSLVRAANTGVSAVVDPRGRVLEATGLFERAVVVHDVPIATGVTLYVRTGDLFAWSCLGISAGLTALALWRRRRESRP